MQPVLQRTIIGQKQKALAIAIQSADRVDSRHGNIVPQRAATSSLVRELTQDVIGLVEQNVAMAHCSGSAKA